MRSTPSSSAELSIPNKELESAYSGYNEWLPNWEGVSQLDTGIGNLSNNAKRETCPWLGRSYITEDRSKAH